MNLRTEGLSNPLGMGEPRPRLSWSLEGAAAGFHPRATQVQAAVRREQLERGEATLWDSSRVEIGEQDTVEYAGRLPGSRRRVYWKVRVWGEDQNPSPWSETAFFEMGLLRPEDWLAEWISDGDGGGSRKPDSSIVYRKSFPIPSTPVRARLYTASIRLPDLSINGQTAGITRLTPDWIEHSSSLPILTYDVTRLLHPRENVIGCVLHSGESSACLLTQLEIELVDGNLLVVISDTTWKFIQIVESNLQTLGSWTGARYDDSIWQEAQFCPQPDIRLVAWPRASEESIAR